MFDELKRGLLQQDIISWKRGLRFGILIPLYKAEPDTKCMIPETSPSQEMCFFFLIWFQTTVFQTHFYLVKKWYWTTVNILLLFCSKSRDFILSRPHSVFVRRSRLFILQIRKLRHRMKSLNYFLMELEALPGLRLAFTWPITYHSSVIGRYPSLTLQHYWLVLGHSLGFASTITNSFGCQGVLSQGQRPCSLFLLFTTLLSAWWRQIPPLGPRKKREAPWSLAWEVK